MECLNTLLTQGAGIKETGFICLSKKRKNQVISNIIGAAAYFGSTEVLKNLLSMLNVL
jgi:hypothetical protein